ncbi:MAG: hypothetical protein KF775_06145 [Cyclobacteriaceae bacterium]|nr:hypothetical protein [Cyclobacteriaceae bacterium]
MKKLFPIFLMFWLITLSSFESESVNYEQITFDFFVSDILATDFKNVTSFEFKGKTENSYATLGKFKFCLSPEEKLGTIIESAIKGVKSNEKRIEFKDIEGLKITDFQRSKSDRLFVYPSLHVADNHYVFLLFRNKEQAIKYVFELTPEGDILRSCKLD